MIHFDSRELRILYCRFLATEDRDLGHYKTIPTVFGPMLFTSYTEMLAVPGRAVSGDPYPYPLTFRDILYSIVSSDIYRGTHFVDDVSPILQWVCSAQ